MIHAFDAEISDGGWRGGDRFYSTRFKNQKIESRLTSTLYNQKIIDSAKKAEKGNGRWF